MRCMGLRHRLHPNSFLPIGRRSISNDSGFSPPELVKSGSLYLLTNRNTLLRVWTILRDDNKLVCYNEPDRSLVVASMLLKDHRVLSGRGTTIENNIFFPLYIVEKDQLEECVFAETLASQREWLEAMTSTMDLDQSLSLEGLNLECGKCKEQEKEKMNKEPIPSYFSENAPPLSALRDLQDNKQTALRRATLLKQRMISTELKVDGLKKLQPEPIYEIPANKLYYQIQLDELNIKLDNYTEAFHKYHELRRQSVSEYLARFTGQKKNDEHDYITMEANESNKYRSAFRTFGSFLDTKLRGHKRTKSADVKRHEYIDTIRPRSISSNTDRKLSDDLLETSFGKERILRTEISASALREIEEFEKFIKKYLENHPEEYFL